MKIHLLHLPCQACRLNYLNPTETQTPYGIITNATLEVSGQTTCTYTADQYKTAITTTLTGTTQAAYACMDNGDCQVRIHWARI